MIRQFPVWAAAAAVAVSGPALAGPEWVEPKGKDAGSLPGFEQTPQGTGGLTAIRGSLGGLGLGPGSDPADLIDLYVICVDDPELFLASTLENLGGFAEGFDSRLFLFSLSGQGILANDNTPALNPGSGFTESTLFQSSNDGTGSLIQHAGLYLLGVCVTPQEPRSGGGPLFFFKSPFEISGPDGPGGDGPVIEWIPTVGACCLADGSCQNVTEEICTFELNGFYQGDDTSCDDADACPVVGACVLLKQFCIVTTQEDCKAQGGFYKGDGVECQGPPPPPLPPPGKGVVGEYKIVLQGVCFPDDVPVGACLFGKGECIVTDEFTCAASEGEFLGEGTSCCEGDVNGDLVVDVQDMVAVLTQWGCEGKGECPADVNDDGVVDVADLIIVITTWGPCFGE